jgi:hypothetical protein
MQTFTLRMKYTQEDLGLIEKHVAQGEKNVQQQRQIVRGLRKGGYPTDESLEILAALETTLQALRQRRTRIRIEISAKDPSRTLDSRVLTIGRPHTGLGRS